MKPANVLLDAQGRAYPADYGLARLPGQVDVSSKYDLVGTAQ